MPRKPDRFVGSKGRFSRVYQDPLSLDVLMPKVEKITESGCWIWTAHCNNMGYGMLGVDRKMKLAHRMTYELTYGQIPKGLDLDHL